MVYKSFPGLSLSVLFQLIRNQVTKSLFYLSSSHPHLISDAYMSQALFPPSRRIFCCSCTRHPSFPIPGVLFPFFSWLIITHLKHFHLSVILIPKEVPRTYISRTVGVSPFAELTTLGIIFDISIFLPYSVLTQYSIWQYSVNIC